MRDAEREARYVVRSALAGSRGDELSTAILDLYREVPREGWLARGVARVLLGTVVRKGEGTWLVYGVPEFGDWHGYYIVSLEKGKYRCSCFSTGWGWRRARRICTHVAAVMLARRRASPQALGCENERARERSVNRGTRGQLTALKFPRPESTERVQESG